MEIPPLGTVLCPVDLSEHSQAALYLAAGLAGHRDSRLIVLRVDDRLSTENDVAAARIELDEFVHQTLSGSSRSLAGTTTVIAHGVPATQILAHAASNGATLIVMGTRGRGALGRALIGSTTEQVMRKTSVPLVVVPPSHPEIVSLAETKAVPHVGIVVVPFDLSTPSQHQLDWAAKLSMVSEHPMLLLYVVPKGTDREVSRERLEAFAQTMSTARGVRTLVLDGDVVNEVVKVVLREPVGVIVLGRSANQPGKLAYELVRRTRNVVVLVP